jgi:hypothetical protein
MRSISSVSAEAPAEAQAAGRRHGAGVDAVEVAAGRQHVEAAAGRRAGRPRARRSGRRGRRAGRRSRLRRRLQRRAGRPSISPRTAAVRSSGIGPRVRPRRAPAASCSSRSTVSPCAPRVPAGPRPSGAGRGAGRLAQPCRRAGRVEPEIGASALISEASPPLPSPRGRRTSATSRSRAARPRAPWPKMCRPSRICSSFSSQRWLSSLASARRVSPSSMPSPCRGRGRSRAPGSRAQAAGGAGRAPAACSIRRPAPRDRAAAVGSRPGSAAASGGRR